MADTPNPTSAPLAAPAARTGGLTMNSAAMLAYCTVIPAILFLLIEPYKSNKFVRYNCYQSIAFTVLASITHLAAYVFIPRPYGALISFALTFVYFAMWVITAIKASKGEYFKLPLTGNWAMKKAQ